MKKGTFIIDEKIAGELKSYYSDMQMQTDVYRRELSRSFAARQARGGTNFSVFGRTLTLEDMLKVQDFFLSRKPLDCQAELMFLLHERENIGGVRFVMESLEGFLRKLPGAKLPASRPAAMDELLRMK